MVDHGDGWRLEVPAEISGTLLDNPRRARRRNTPRGLHELTSIQCAKPAGPKTPYCHGRVRAFSRKQWSRAPTIPSPARQGWSMPLAEKTSGRG